MAEETDYLINSDDYNELIPPSKRKKENPFFESLKRATPSEAGAFVLGVGDLETPSSVYDTDILPSDVVAYKRYENQPDALKYVNSVLHGALTYGEIASVNALTWNPMTAGLVATGSAYGVAKTGDVSGALTDNPIFQGISAVGEYLKGLTPVYGAPVKNDLGDYVSDLPSMVDMVSESVGFMMGGRSSAQQINKYFTKASDAVRGVQLGKTVTDDINALNKLGQFTKAVGPFAATLYGRATESMIEANQTAEEIRRSLEQENEDYVILTGQRKYSNDEIENLANDSKSKNFWFNMALGSIDYVQNLNLLKGFNTDLASALALKGAGEMTKSQARTKILSSFIKNLALEGEEEALQWASNKAAIDSAGQGFLTGFLPELGEEYINSWSDPEGQLSRLVGAAIGGPAGAFIEGAAEVQDINSRAAKYKTILEEQKNVPGEPVDTNFIYTKKQTPEGKMVKTINREYLNSMNRFNELEQVKTFAIQNNDKPLYEMAESLQLFNKTLAHVETGTLDQFIDELETFKKASPEELAKNGITTFGESELGQPLSPQQAIDNKINSVKKIAEFVNKVNNDPVFGQLSTLGKRNLMSLATLQETTANQLKQAENQLAYFDLANERQSYIYSPEERAKMTEPYAFLPFASDRAKAIELRDDVKQLTETNNDLLKKYKEWRDPKIAFKKDQFINENAVKAAAKVEDVKREQQEAIYQTEYADFLKNNDLKEKTVEELEEIKLQTTNPLIKQAAEKYQAIAKAKQKAQSPELTTIDTIEITDTLNKAVQEEISKVEFEPPAPLEKNVAADTAILSTDVTAEEQPVATEYGAPTSTNQFEMERDETGKYKKIPVAKSSGLEVTVVARDEFNQPILTAQAEEFDFDFFNLPTTALPGSEVILRVEQTPYNQTLDLTSKFAWQDAQVYVYAKDANGTLRRIAQLQSYRSVQKNYAANQVAGLLTGTISKSTEALRKAAVEQYQDYTKGVRSSPDVTAVVSKKTSGYLLTGNELPISSFPVTQIQVANEFGLLQTSDGKTHQVTPGAVYMIIPSSNGQPIPIRTFERKPTSLEIDAVLKQIAILNSQASKEAKSKAFEEIKKVLHIKSKTDTITSYQQDAEGNYQSKVVRIYSATKEDLEGTYLRIDSKRLDSTEPYTHITGESFNNYVDYIRQTNALTSNAAPQNTFFGAKLFLQLPASDVTLNSGSSEAAMPTDLQGEVVDVLEIGEPAVTIVEAKEEAPTTPASDIEADIEKRLGIKLPAKNTSIPVSPKTWGNRKSLANQISSELKGVVERGVSMQEWLDKGYGRQLATWSDEVIVEFLEVADIERRRQEDLDYNKDATPFTEKDFTDFNLEVDTSVLGKYEFTLSRGSEESEEIIIVNSIQEGINKINAKYDAELAALESKTQLTPEQAEAVTTAVKDTVKATQNLKEVTKQKFKNIKLSVIEDEKVNDIEYQKQWLSNTLGLSAQSIETILPELQKVHGDIKAYGAFWNGLVYLSSDAPIGTAYHEGFHFVFDMALDEPTKKEILAEAVKRYSEPDIKERFRLQKMYGKNWKQIYYEERLAEDYKVYELDRTKEKGLIAKVFDTIASLVNRLLGNKSVVDELFSKISDGKFKGVINEYTGPAKFSIAEDFKTTGELRRRLKYINFNAYAALKQLESDGVIPAVFEAPASVVNKVYADLKTEFIEYSAGIPQLQKVVNNWDEVVTLAKKEFRSMGYEVNEDAPDKQLDAAQDEEKAKDTKEQVYDKPVWEDNRKESLRKDIKTFFHFIPALSEDGELLGDDIDAPFFMDFNEVYPIVTKATAGATNLQDMIDELKARQSFYPWMRTVIEGLENPQTSNQFKNAFFTSMDNQYVKMVTVLTAENKTAQVINTNRNSLRRVIADEWVNNFEKQFVTVDTATQKETIKVPETAQKLFREVTAFLVELEKTLSVTEEEVNTLTDYLKQIGIKVNPRTLQTAMLDMGIKKKLVSGKTNLNYLFKDFAAGKNPIQTQTTPINNLITIEMDSRSNDAMDSFLSGKKKSVYPYVPHTAISRTIISIKEDEPIEVMGERVNLLDTLLEDSRWSDSWLLNKLKEQDVKDNFDVAYFDTFRNKDTTKEGTAYDEAVDIEWAKTKLNAFLNNTFDKPGAYGWYEIAVPADGQNTQFVKMIKHQTKYANGVLQGESKKLLINLFYEEVNRIRQATTEVESLPDNEQIEHYHYAKTPGDKKGRALQFTIFTQFNDLLFENGQLNLDGKAELIDTTLDAWFSNKVNKYLSFYSKLGLIKQSGETYTNKELDPNAIGEYDSITEFVADYALNKMLVKNGMKRLTIVDDAYYKSLKDADKRMKLWLTPGTGIGNSGSANIAVVKDIMEDNKSYVDLLSKALNSLGASKELTGFIESSYKQNNRTDGQGIMSLSRWDYVKNQQGEITQSIEKAVEKIKQGIATDADLKALIIPIKGLYVGTRWVKRNEKFQAVPMIIKYSTVTFPPAVESQFPEIKKLTDSMTEKGLDELVFNSTVKVGAQGIGNVNDASTWNAISVPNSIYRIPQIVPYKDKTTATFSIQPMLNILTNILDNSVYGDEFTSITGKKLKEQYSQYLSRKITINSEKVNKKLGFGLLDTYVAKMNEYTNNPSEELKAEAEQAELAFNKHVSEMLVEEFGKDEKLPDSYTEGVMLNEDGQFRVPLSSPFYTVKLQQKFLSIIRNKVLRMKMPGFGAVQVSDFAYKVGDQSLQFVKPEFKGDKVVKVAEAEVYVSQDFFRNYLLKELSKLEDKQSERAVRINELLASDLNVENLDEELRKFVAYRTPNQAKNSMLACKIKGFLPKDMGVQIVFPSQITTQMGSDFDIDKAYLMMYNFSVTKDNKLKKLAVGENINELNEYQVENGIIDTFLTVLTSPLHFVENITPNNSKTIEDFLKDNNLETIQGDYLDDVRDVQVKINMQAGKDLIGIDAVRTTTRPLIQIIKPEVNFRVRVEGQTVQSLSELTDAQGTLISDNISERQTADVDNGNNPLMGSANQNLFTSPITVTLNELRFPIKTSLALMNQPVVLYMLQEYNKTNRSSSDQKAVIKKALEQASLAYKRFTQSEAKINNNFDFTYDNLQKYVGEKEYEQDAEYYHTQLQTINLISNIYDFNQEYRRTISLIRPNAENFKNLTEVESYIDETVKALVDNMMIKVKKALPTKFNKQVYEESLKTPIGMVQEFRYKGILEPFDRLATIFDYGTPMFQSLKQNLIFAQNARFPQNELMEFYFFVFNFIHSIDGPFKLNKMQKKDMLYGEKSVGARLLRAQQYEDDLYAKDPTFIRNKFLNSLTVRVKPNGLHVVTFNNTAGRTKNEQSDIMNDFKAALLTPKYATLTEDLAKYTVSFYGFLKGTGSFTDLIPPTYLEQIGYGQWFRKYRNNFQNAQSPSSAESMIEQYFQNRASSGGYQSADLPFIPTKSFTLSNNTATINPNAVDRLLFRKGKYVYPIQYIKSKGETIYVEDKVIEGTDYLFKFDPEQSNINKNVLVYNRLPVVGTTELLYISGEESIKGDIFTIPKTTTEPIVPKVISAQSTATVKNFSDEINDHAEIVDTLELTPTSPITKEPVNKLQGSMTYRYGENKREGLKADSTFDAILSGERTATTRYERDGKIEYWKSAKVGDIITWKSLDGRSVDVVVTKPLHKLAGSGKTPNMWSQLEGWSLDYFMKNVKPKINEAWQIEFKLAKPTTPTVSEGIEINSKQTGLGNDLTNVHYATNGKSKFDIKPSDTSLTLTPEAKKTWGESVEAWYKSNNAKSKGIPEGTEGDAYDMKLMIGLITDKLKQYPNLVTQITERGGLAFLDKSTHTMGTGRWSSKNPKNMFMNALKQAYRNVSTTPTVSTGFQGYRGGFENTGKGTPQGDGKDKAMREVANGFIGEIVKNNTSSQTSRNFIIDKSNKADKSQNAPTSAINIPLQGISGANIIMLARNSERKGAALTEETKYWIRNANLEGAEFVVGDMPGVDSQFIDYLQKIGAKFTIYHTGPEGSSRIKVTQPQAPVSTKIEISSDKFSRASVTEDANTMYLFTDNAQRTSAPNAITENVDKNLWYYKKYKSQTNKPIHFGSLNNPTSAVIRGLNNAYPISTMSAYGTNWTDANFDLFKQTIDDEINQIKQDLAKFNKLKIGNYRIGQGGLKAKLPAQHQNYLDSKLKEIGIDNTGLTPKLITQPQAFVSTIPTTAETKISEVYNTLTEEQKQKIKSLEDLIAEYNEVPFDYDVEDFIQQSIKCKL